MSQAPTYNIHLPFSCDVFHVLADVLHNKRFCNLDDISSSDIINHGIIALYADH